jgi:hypothetical protein
MHKRLAVLVAVLVLVVPSFTSAASLTTEQVNAILSLLRSFGADQTTVNNVNAALGGSVVPPTTPCVALTRDLTIGSTGNDVTSLQNYLISRGHLAAGYNTGYYGMLTAEAVGTLQLSLGIVTSKSDAAYGYMNSTTRARIACSATYADLKINGSDGPLALPDATPITLSWTSSGASSCYITNVRLTSAGPNQTISNLPGYGSYSAYTALSSGNNGKVALQCGSAFDEVQLFSVLVPAPTAAIDQSSLTTSSNYPILSGSAAGVSHLTFHVANSNMTSYASGQVTTATSGRWSVALSYLPAGTYTVKVYKYDPARGYELSSATLLTTGTLTITNPSMTPSCSISVMHYGGGYGVTWSSQNAIAAQISPIPGMGTGYMSVPVVNSSPAAYIGSNTQYTLTVWNSAGAQASCYYSPTGI